MREHTPVCDRNEQRSKFSDAPEAPDVLRNIVDAGRDLRGANEGSYSGMGPEKVPKQVADAPQASKISAISG